jgi:hypothetical protein
MEVVEKDFAYLKGWYDDDWFWLTIGVAPLDEDGKPMEDHREYCGGYESTMINDPECRSDVVSAIEDRIWEIDRLHKSRLFRNQLELCFA